MQVAIVGGGIAGVALALELCRHQHLDVTLFEAVQAFGEVGSGVSFGANAVRGIKALGIGEPYEQIATGRRNPGRAFVLNGVGVSTAATEAPILLRVWVSLRYTVQIVAADRKLTQWVSFQSAPTAQKINFTQQLIYRRQHELKRGLILKLTVLDLLTDPWDHNLPAKRGVQGLPQLRLGAHTA